MPFFDAKLFNGEVFQKYVDRIPNMHLNTLIKSGAIVGRPELAASMSDQVGGNFLTTPLKGLIGGTPLNYDGVTNITSTGTQTYSHSRVVVGRAKAWTEKDFSYDITGGVDFMQNVAEQVAEYWDEQDQALLIKILDGVFAMSDDAGAEFVEEHTHDVSGVTNSEGVLGYMDATTLNTGMQKAMGDHKQKFALTLMHSAVATHLENLKVLVYLKYNDANGIERDLNIGTLNGRMVIVDDDMPVITEGSGTSAVKKYVTYVFGQGAVEYTNCGAKVPAEMARDPYKNGGEDTLITRNRKCFAPYGISFKGIGDIATLSPNDTELATGANWEIVNTGGSSKIYLPHKAIPIARIISLG
jgi:hypothetical protein